MLSVDTLRDHLAAALAWSEPEVGAYLDALQARGGLPADEAALDVDHLVSVLLALLSGAPPAEAVDEARRMWTSKRSTAAEAKPRT